jgi:hypothetical protein
MILRNRLIFPRARVSLVFEGHLCDGRARAAFEQRKRRRSKPHPALPPREPHNVTNDTGKGRLQGNGIRIRKTAANGDGSGGDGG